MRQKLLALTAIVSFVPLYAATVPSYTQIVAFGDSLTDNGNAFLFTSGSVPGPNYGLYTFPGNPPLTTSFFSDGLNTSPVASGPQGLWIDQLSSRLGVPDPRPALAGGTNYAVAGAETGLSPVTLDMGLQVQTYLTTNHSNVSSSLFVLWGGANDVIDGKNSTVAADNIESYISVLSAIGAKNFLWLNLPLLGDTPEGSANKAAFNSASVAFNSEWAKDITALQGSGIDVVGVNIGALFTNIVSNPGQYGFTNVTSPAQTSGNATDAGYLFWDGLHPTTTGHMLVADAAYDALTATTPEPATASLAVFGVLALAGLVAKGRRGKTTQ